MKHHEQQAVEALVTVTHTMLKVWYDLDCGFTIGELSQAIDRCAEIFQFTSPHLAIKVKHYALVQLMATHKIVEDNE